MKVFVVTCPERRTEAKRTVELLHATDFPAVPHVLTDPHDGPPSAARHERWRRTCFDFALDRFPGEHLFCFLEDDIEPARWWWAALCAWPALKRDMLVASLYCPANRTGETTAPNTRDSDGRLFYGGQAIVISRSMLELARHRWEPLPPDALPNWDKRLGRIAHDAGVPVTYHVPSLFQHRCAPTLSGAAPHIAADFEATWRP